MKEVTTGEVFSYLFKNIKAFPISILIMLLTPTIWAIDLSLRPYLLKVILNRITSDSQENIYSHLAVPVLSYLTMIFLILTAYRLYNYFIDIKMIPRLREKIAKEALALLLDKSHNYYQSNYSGSLSNKINDLTSRVPEMIQIIFDKFYSHSLAISIAIFTLWQVNALFAFFMLLLVIAFISGALLFSKTITLLARSWSESGSAITGEIVDVLSNILSVHLFAAKSQEEQSLSRVLQTAVDAEQKMNWAYFWIWLYYGIASFTILVFNFYFLIKGRKEGWVTVGDFALVMFINISIFDFLWNTAQEISRFSMLFGRVKQALIPILSEPEIRDKTNAIDLKVARGNITFDKVNFHYKGNKALFKNTSITIEAGQKVGLVGYSGSGKTTFVNLILRLYDVTDGCILIDNQDISEVTQSSLRNNIAMIPQDPSLFHRSLLDNIRYGKSGATEAQVIEAAKHAYAHDFITNLPHGYETLAGERGVKLSGGQRQRIAIARAFLKNASILILDEATSQLDSITESYIQGSLWELMQGKTTIVIAHRLSTLLHMDHILVFEQGEIVEDGHHQDLIAKNGMYKTLWDAQVGGFLPDKKRE